MFETKVFKIEMKSPDDVSMLRELFDQGVIDPKEVVAVLAKTEGNGCVNDFTRGLCTQSFKILMAKYLQLDMETVEKKIAFVMSGGTEGILTPHATIFCRGEAKTKCAAEKGLAIGIGFTRNFLPEEIGTMVQVREVARVVKEAMCDAGINDTRDVHFVQIKCPLLTSQNIAEAKQRGKSVVVNDTYESMGYSRGASALGIAIGLDEIELSEIDDSKIAKDWKYYSAVASTSSGVELSNCEVILMGNSENVISKYRIGHGVMKDALDYKGVLQAFHSAGLEFEHFPCPEQLKKIFNVFAKAEADPTGFIRGRRHTMLTDSDINHTRHARAVVGAIIASLIGDSMIYISGGAEHQGPAGGGPVAVIIEKS